MLWQDDSHRMNGLKLLTAIKTAIPFDGSYACAHALIHHTNKFFKDSKTYLGRLLQNQFVYNDERRRVVTRKWPIFSTPFGAVPRSLM